MSYSFMQSSIRTRLLIIFLPVTTIAIVIFAAVLFIQFRDRALDTARGDLTTVLAVASQRIIADLNSGILLNVTPNENTVALLNADLAHARVLAKRSDASLFIALPTEDNSGFQTIASENLNTPPETLEAAWAESAAAVMSEADQSRLDFFGTYVIVKAVFADDYGGGASGFAPLFKAGEGVVGIVGAEVHTYPAFDVKLDVLKTTAILCLILYPLTIIAVFLSARKLAAQAVEKVPT